MFLRFSRRVLLMTLALSLVSPAWADEPITFRYKLEKGAKQITLHKTETKTTQTIAGTDYPNTVGQTSVETKVIDDLGADGTAKFKTKTERLKAVAKLGPAGDYEFDSQKTDRDKSSTLGAALTPLYERLVGSELQFETTPRGVVTSYTGYAQLVGDLVKDNPLASQFAGGGSDSAAKLSTQGQYIVFPEKAVKAGDKWENPFEMEMPGLGTIKGKQIVTFVTLETRDGHSIAKFTTTSDIAFDLNLDMGGMKVTGKITTSNSTGSAEFDVTAGKMLNQKGEVTLTGQLSLSVNNMMIPIQMTQTATTEQTELDKLPE